MFNTSNNYLITIMEYTASEERKKVFSEELLEEIRNYEYLPPLVEIPYDDDDYLKPFVGISKNNNNNIITPWKEEIRRIPIFVDDKWVYKATYCSSKSKELSPITNEWLRGLDSTAQAVELKILNLLNFLLNSEEILKENPSFSMNDCYTDVFKQKYSILKPSDKDGGIVIDELTASLKAEDNNIMSMIAKIEKKCLDLHYIIDAYVKAVSEKSLTCGDVFREWTAERKRTLKLFEQISIPNNLDSDLTSLLRRFINNILLNLISSEQFSAFERLFGK